MSQSRSMIFKPFAALNSHRVEVLGLVLLFLVAFALLFLASPYYVNVYDEGIILTGALRVLFGEKPSTNFYANYGPAQFYLVAWVLELFGRSITISRVYDALIAAAILPAAWSVLRDAALRWYAPAALGVILVLLLLSRSPLYPVTPCIVLILFGCQLTIHALTGRGPAAAFLPVALVIGALTTFRYFFGAIGFAAFGTTILVILALQVWTGSVTLARAVETVLGAALLMGLAFAGTLGALYAAGILEPALHDLLTYNMGNYLEMRALPFPDLAAIRARPRYSAVIYLPPATCLLGFVTCLLLGRNGRDISEKRITTIVVFITVTLFFYGQALVRTDPIHTLVSDVPAVILGFLCLDSLEKRFVARLSRPVRTGTRAMVLAVAALVVVHGLNITTTRNVLYHHLGTAPGHPDVPAIGLFTAQPDRIEAARYVIETTGPGEQILSATGRHDKIFVNDSAFYFLVQRLPGTRWHQYEPGVQTTAEVQGQMIRELEENAVSVIIRDTTWDGITEPNKSAESSGVTLLDDYIARNYREVRAYGPITVHRRVH